MSNIKSLLSATFMLLILSACQSADTQPDRPEWLDDPGNNFIGKCGTHIKGAIAQEQCAYKKGLTSIAMSKGVTVDVDAAMSMKQTSSQSSGTSQGQLEATVKMDAKDVKISGTIIDKWHDRARDIMYVLIKEN